MNDRGQGRKPLNESGELMKSRPIRTTRSSGPSSPLPMRITGPRYRKEVQA